MSFAENLKILRKEKYLSQEQLAEIIGVSRQAVSKWEQGSGYPEMEKLINLAKKLDISLDVLLLDKSCRQRPRNSGCNRGKWTYGICRKCHLYPE